MNEYTQTRIRAANAADWESKARTRAQRTISWKADVQPSRRSFCGGDAHGDAAQADRLQANIGYTQPCSGPVAYEVDSIDFCPKHLVQSGR